MKFLLLVFFVGFAAANFYDELFEAHSDALESFKQEFDDAYPYAYEMEEGDTVEKVKNKIDEIIEKMKDKVDKGQQITEDLITKYRELKKKLKQMGGDLGDKLKELLNKVKDKWVDMMKKLLDRMEQKRSLNELEHASMKDMLQQLKELVKKHLNIEELKQKIMDRFGDFKELKDVLIQELKEHGKKALKEFIEHLLEKNNKEKKSLKEMWEKLKEYVKKAKLEWKDKFATFFEFLKEKMGEKLEQGKDKLEQMKLIAKEMIEHHKEVSKEVALEALDFLRPYKEDLGNVWNDFKKSIKEVLTKNE